MEPLNAKAAKKIREIGIFSFGTGAVYVSVFVYLFFIMNSTRSGGTSTGAIVAVAIAAVPLLMGIWVLMAKNLFAAKVSCIVVTAVFALAGLFPVPNATLGWAVLVGVLMFKTLKEAREAAHPKSVTDAPLEIVSVPSTETPVTDQNPFANFK